MTWQEWADDNLPFGCFRWWVNLLGDCPSCQVKFIDSTCEGMGDVMAWNGILPYLRSIGLDLKPAEYRKDWPDSRLDYNSL